MFEIVTMNVDLVDYIKWESGKGIEKGGGYLLSFIVPVDSD